MVSKPSLRAYPETLPPYSKKKPRGTGASLSPGNGNQQAWTDFRARNPLARSAGPLASATFSSGRWIQATYVIADLFCVTVAFAAVLIARYLPASHGYSTLGSATVLRAIIPRDYVGVLVLYSILIVLFLRMYGLYYTPRDRSKVQEIALVAKALSWSTAMLMATIYLSGARPISRLVILASAATNVVVLASWRMWKRDIIERRVAAGIGVRNIVVVGAGKIGREIAEHFGTKRHLGVVVKGFLDDNHVGNPRVLGRIENLVEICRTHFVDEVIITIPSVRSRVRRVLIQARLNNLDVKIVPDMYGSFARGATLEHLGRVPVMSLRKRPIPVFSLVLKRAMDIIGSVIGLALSSPFMAAIAVAIWLDTPGPVFYRGRRAGRKGRQFVCYKFRTMVENADALKDSLLSRNERQGATFKIAGDPRITRVGRLLRKSSLDELPQLWNVLKGEMSLVGPRPHPVEDFQRYDLEHLRRLDVTPGITGLWQVAARRDPSFDRNVALDVEYIEEWSIWTDLKILLRTLSVVVAGTGA